jgi:hypothetical protein
MAFTAAVIVNIVAVATGRYANWVGFLAVLPLAFLLLTALYLFVLPYAAKWRSRRTTEERGHHPAVKGNAVRTYEKSADAPTITDS